MTDNSFVPILRKFKVKFKDIDNKVKTAPVMISEKTWVIVRIGVKSRCISRKEIIDIIECMPYYKHRGKHHP